MIKVFFAILLLCDIKNYSPIKNPNFIFFKHTVNNAEKKIPRRNKTIADIQLGNCWQLKKEADILKFLIGIKVGSSLTRTAPQYDKD